MEVNSLSATKPVGVQAMLESDPRRMLLLRRTFWLGIVVLTAYGALSQTSVEFETGLGSILIAAASLIPAGLWCYGKVRGIPIYPLYALTFLWTYSLPLISKHPVVTQYTPQAHLNSSLIVSGFLLLGTAVWARMSRYPLPEPESILALEGKTGEPFFFITLILVNAFMIFSNSGWLNLGDGVFAIIRGVLFSLSSLATFVLSYQWGQGAMNKVKVQLLIILLLIAIFSNIITLLLIGALSILVLAGAGYTLGRGRIPWGAFLGILICLAVLHSGKTAMRHKYWYRLADQEAVQPWQYPARIAEWASYSLDFLFDPDVDKTEESAPFYQRASLIHLLLMAQEKSAQDVPFMMGATYLVIPQLLVPRIIMPDKPTSHEGTYLLNIHYGLQSREQALGTTLGWGMLNESYANFGVMGCAMLAVLIGGGYGLLSKWSINAPILSARFLFTVLILSMAYQTEYSASVYFTVLFQSAIPLLAVAIIFMKPQHLGIGTKSKKQAKFILLPQTLMRIWQRS